MQSAPKIESSGHGSISSLLKRLRDKLRCEPDFQGAPGPRQLAFNPLGQHPVQPASRGTARIESDSSERASVRSNVSLPSTQPLPSAQSARSAQSAQPEPSPARLPNQELPSPPASEEELQGVAGEPSTQVSDAAATPPTAPVPSSLLGKPAPGNRRQGSGWKSGETQVGDPDAITPAPPVEKKRMFNSSFSAGSTLLGGETKRENNHCHICDHALGKPRGKNHKIERLAFLPCGHVFGHECLFHWLTVTGRSRYCPDCCVTMRHACEHLTAPTKLPPVQAFTNVKAAVMPWNYEFCESSKGLRLHANIRRRTDRLHRAEAKNTTREKSAMGFAHDAACKFHAHVVTRAERRLDVEHKAWWARRWASFAVA